MHTEHLQNVHAGWVVAGWLVAFATTSLAFLALAGLGLMGAAGGAETAWEVLAVAAGFFIGGLFAGFRSIDAPILHGIGIGLTTLVAWFLLNVLVPLFLPQADWQALTPAVAAGLLLVQLVAAVGGAWTGHRIAIRGGPEPPEIGVGTR